MSLSLSQARKSIALICIAVVVVAAVSTAAVDLFSAVLVPLWLLTPAVAVVRIRQRAARCDDQPVSLVALLPSRVPPLTPVLS